MGEVDSRGESNPLRIISVSREDKVGWVGPTLDLLSVWVGVGWGVLGEKGVSREDYGRGLSIYTATLEENTSSLTPSVLVLEDV
jgi:hypothetical protein